MKTIGFYVENYLGGGLERFLFDLAKSLTKEGNRVILFYGRDSNFPDRLRAAGLAELKTVYAPVMSTKPLEDYLYALHLPKILWKVCLIPLDLCRFILAWLNIGRCKTLFSAYSLDILQAINGGYPAATSCLSAVLAGKRLGIPQVLLSITGIPQPRRWPILETCLDRQVAKAITLAISVCDYGAQQLHSLRDFPLIDIKSIPCGLPEGSLPPDTTDTARKRREWGLEGKTVIGNISALEAYKGHRYLIQAMAVLHKDYPDIRCLIIGSGNEESRLRDLIHSLGLETIVRMTGYLENRRTGYDLMDIFVHPTLEDAFPYVILEAMELGKPIVATPIGGIPEQLEPMKSGILVKAASATALAEAIESLLKNPTQARALGQEARQRVAQNFSIQRMVQSFLEIYR